MGAAQRDLVDASDRAALDRDGYVVIEDLIPPDRLDTLQGRILQLFDELSARDSGRSGFLK